MGVPAVSALPIPRFTEIKEAYLHGHHHLEGVTNAAFICPDLAAGRQPRYTVVRLDYISGRMTVIGREVDIWISRALARRSMLRDGQGLTPAELKAGRQDVKVWRGEHGYLCCKDSSYPKKAEALS